MSGTSQLSQIQSEYIDAGDLRIHYLESGQGMPLLCLHGFPDHSGIWKPLMSRLADNFRVIAPDQRGYNLTSRPKSEDAYKTECLVQDIVAFMDALDLLSVSLCGHDWGGIIAFHVAMKVPERVANLIILNSAHPYMLQDMIWDNPAQREASQYVRRLQADGAASTFDPTKIEALLQGWFSGPVERGIMSSADVEAYRQAWIQPGVWDAMLKWYRASNLHIPSSSEKAPSLRWTEGLDYSIHQPVLQVWGDEDKTFDKQLPIALEEHAKRLRTVWLPGIGHTPQREAPDDTAIAIKQFLNTNSDAAFTAEAAKTGL